MEQKAKSLASLACLALLAACDCTPDRPEQNITNEPVIVEDNSLRGDAADFIAKAGDRVFFAFDDSGLSVESKATLERQAAWLKEHSDRKILIEGHCDDIGTREYNLGLGERRADSAAKFLLAQGISGDRVRTISYGKDRPIDAQGTQKEVRRLNRVAIVVVE